MAVLLAEDNDDLVRLYTAYLARSGHRVVRASNGEEVLSAMQSHRPDLILLDLEMPVMTGFETLERLRAGSWTRTVPVVIFTNAELDSTGEARLHRLGVEASWSKP